jgi:hypothetical protein
MAVIMNEKGWEELFKSMDEFLDEQEDKRAKEIMEKDAVERCRTKGMQTLMKHLGFTSGMNYWKYDKRGKEYGYYAIKVTPCGNDFHVTVGKRTAEDISEWECVFYSLQHFGCWANDNT